MLAKCSNSSCAASFRSLGNGQLFQLEKDGRVQTSKPGKIEYFWLCEACARTMTLRIREDGAVVAVTLPDLLRTAPVGVAVRMTDRRNGLSLRSIGSNFLRRARFSPRKRARRLA